MLRAFRFDLPGYRVLEVVDTALGVRRVLVESTEPDGGCPVLRGPDLKGAPAHSQRLRDVPVAGPVRVLWRSAGSLAPNPLPACDVRHEIVQVPVPGSLYPPSVDHRLKHPLVGSQP